MDPQETDLTLDYGRSRLPRYQPPNDRNRNDDQGIKANCPMQRQGPKTNDNIHLDLPLPSGIDHEVPRWSAFYSIYSEMRRLLPSPSTSPCSLFESGSGSESWGEGEKEGDGDGEEDGTVRVKEEVGERSDSGFGDGDCGSMGSLDCSGGSGISTTSLDWDESLAPLGTKSVGLEQEQEQEQEQSQGEVAACDPRLLYRDLALEEAPHCGSGIDIGVGAGHDVFMNDLDALLRF
ncbi:hypothetical protein N7461_005880 [Penicillium sp. DV-2018c]|nr:hypothetical protein N7461_005880 [Penicillium sp. DV-2018c]